MTAWNEEGADPIGDWLFWAEVGKSLSAMTYDPDWAEKLGINLQEVIDSWESTT